jgi:hypothetical protein
VDALEKRKIFAFKGIEPQFLCCLARSLFTIPNTQCNKNKDEICITYFSLLVFYYYKTWNPPPPLREAYRLMLLEKIMPRRISWSYIFIMIREE